MEAEVADMRHLLRLSRDAPPDAKNSTTNTIYHDMRGVLC